MPSATNDPGTASSVSMEVYTNNSFWLEMDGILEAVFQECSGLNANTETFKVKEGGLNTHVHQLPDRTTFTNVTLKSGFTSSNELWTWYKNTVLGTPQRKNITIYLYKPDYTVLKSWQLTNAYPIKWNGPSLNAKANEVMVESIELAFDFFQIAP